MLVDFEGLSIENKGANIFRYSKNELDIDIGWFSEKFGSTYKCVTGE